MIPLSPVSQRQARAFRRGVDPRLCLCGGCGHGETSTLIPEDGEHVYECPGCERLVPWCFGAADRHPELCDDCWGEADEGLASSREGAGG